MVFYLKYRPKKISDLDSKALQEKLENVLKGKLPDNIPHAFLFTGPKGLGKTSTARIVSKVINCTNRKANEFEPCNKCDSCKAIDAGASLDVLEIDGASNRGIDEIRDLREKIRLAPVNSKKKIYIIDEVHMLTTEAFNALLKTLEEPPSHAIFILCTTESQKIPETIASRCFNVRFTRATDDDLVHSFKRILKGEDIEADDGALLQIAQMSDGSFRDGAKILEEISLNETQIDIKTLEDKYNFQTINKSLTDLIESLRNKDSKKGIEIVSNLAKENTDFKIFTESLIDKLHKELISQAEGGSSEVTQTRNLITMLVKSHVSIKYAILPQLPLELTIVEWCSQDEISNLRSQISNIEETKEISKPKTQIPNIEAAKKDEKVDYGEFEKPQKNSGKKAGGSDNILESIIERVKKDNFSVAGVLRGCSVEKFDEKTLVLSTGFAFHKEKLSDKKIIEMLEKNLKEITGKNIKVEIDLSQ